MRPKYEYGEAVRVLRNIRNDGTYPGMPTGALLVRRGSLGYVRDLGVFLQDQLIYSVDFLDVGRMIGCREAELQPEADEWIPGRFETRERVIANRHLSSGGNIIVTQGSQGEVLRVIRDQAEQRISYHVYFPGHTLEVPEEVLDLDNREQAAPLEGVEALLHQEA